MSTVCRKQARLLGLLAAILLLAQQLDAQTPGDHAAHHPSPAGTAPAGTAEPSPAPPSRGPQTVTDTAPAPGGSGGSMGGTMGGMEVMMRPSSPPPEPLYPFLMRFPDLTAAARLEVAQRADRDAREGLAALERALGEARDAARRSDVEAGASAAAAAREAMDQIDAARAVQRALEEGRAPREVALAWFRREMSLVPGAAGAGVGDRPRASPWRHRLGIGALAAVAIVLLAGFAVRVRRASALVERLTKSETDDVGDE